MRYNKNKRYRLNFKRFSLVLFLATVIIIGATFLINAVTGNSVILPFISDRTANTANTNIFSPDEDANANPPVPEATEYSCSLNQTSNPDPNQGQDQPQPTPAPSGMVNLNELTDHERKLLVLVNWEYHTDKSRPEDLVKLKEIFSDEVKLSNPNGLMNKEAGQAASDMFKAAKAAGIDDYIINSAYREYSYQEQLYKKNLDNDPNYGSDPYNKPVKCLPGYASEHTTGLALDILAVSYNAANSNYAETKEGKWLAENAYKYGFILRYPDGKESITGVIFEPWHYRYVGVDTAKSIFESGLCFEEYVKQIGLYD